MKIKIAHMYPELLNLYGDKGNITALVKRLNWRGIDAEVKEYSLSDKLDFSDTDIVFLGGGSDREQAIVCKKLLENKDMISEYVENNGTLAAVCGGYQLLGEYYSIDGFDLEGLSIMKFHTSQKPGRLIGKAIIESTLFDGLIVGFENHGGRTFTGDIQPLGNVKYGFGNNGKDKKEGAVYKNVIGTYLHGPVLPANPRLTDYILKCAIQRKYGEFTLSPLDDAAENAAAEYIIKKYL